MDTPTTFYSHGKLLITGEYLIIEGAKGLAVPTQKGQTMQVAPTTHAVIKWQSFDEKGLLWLEETLPIQQLKQGYEQQSLLSKVLHQACLLNPLFLSGSGGFEVRTMLDFERGWGLGSSSTWISNIAQWAAVNPYQLFWSTFSGSGYDIACATSQTPISYELINKTPYIKPVYFYPDFAEHLYFIYLNGKQHSESEVFRFKQTAIISQSAIQDVSRITEGVMAARSIERFSDLLNAHEALISKCINRATVKELFFGDYPHSIKSLGAWGGDFVLVVGEPTDMGYFKKKGYDVIMPFSRMVCST